MLIAKAYKTFGRDITSIRVLDALGLFLILYLSCISLNRFDTSYDTLAYHLPYAGLRSGIIKPAQFVLPAGLAERYRGFPPVVDLVQGGLWKLFGRPEAAELIATISVLIFGIYLRITYKLSIFWTVCLFLAVPILHTALNSAMTDLWTNTFFALHLFAAVQPGRSKKDGLVHTAISCIALAIAVNSKEQFYIVGALSYSLILLEKAFHAFRTNPSVAGKASAFNEILVFVFAFPVIFYSPLRDLILFGNPIYPIGLKILGHKLPGAEINSGWWGPNSLAHAPQPVRYFLSQLDLEATNLRPDGYTIGQGDQPGPAGQPGDRMGGSLAVLLISAITCLIVGLMKIRSSARTPLIAGFLVLVTFIAFFPGSNELRYFSFIEITIIVSALYILTISARQGDQSADTFLFCLKCLLLYSAIYVGALNGFSHFMWPKHAHVKNVISEFGARGQISEITKNSRVVCYARGDQLALLYAPVLNANKIKKEYQFVVARNASECPTSAAIIQ